MIYLDNAATTYPKPEVVYRALDLANREYGFNSGRGGYKKAKEVSNIIDETRNRLAKVVDADAENVIFTTSSTEALNIILFGIEWNKGDNIYVSPFEHNSVMRPLYEIQRRYEINIFQIPFDYNTWNVDYAKFNDMMTLNRPKGVICSSKSNVTGYNLPIHEIFALSKKFNSINLLDASQSFGVDKSISKQNVDYIVFAGHKSLYASFGVAGFINVNNNFLNPLIFGGTGSDSLNLEMPKTGTSHLEAGSKNIIAIYGLHESIQWLTNNDVEKKEKELFKYLLCKIKELPKVKVYIPDNVECCSGILSFNVEGYTAEEVGDILNEEYDICVRTGYHCCPYVHDFIGSRPFNGTVRISVNFFNTNDDIDVLINALHTL